MSFVHRVRFFASLQFCAAICVALQGYEASAAPPADEMRSVAVISAIGETFMFEHVRDRAFEWFGPPDASFLEVSDWGIDDLVVRDATAFLSRRFKVVAAKYQEADFDTWTPFNLTRHIRELPLPDDTVDAYILILRDWRADEIGCSVHDIGGLGLYRRDGSGGAKVGVYAAWRVVIVDAHSDEILASQPAVLAGGRLPWLPAAELVSPNTQNDLSDGEKSILQAGVKTLLQRTFVPTLTRALADIRRPRTESKGKES